MCRRVKSGAIVLCACAEGLKVVPLCCVCVCALTGAIAIAQVAPV